MLTLFKKDCGQSSNHTSENDWKKLLCFRENLVTTKKDQLFYLMNPKKL